jgi:hypothetical protein
VGLLSAPIEDVESDIIAYRQLAWRNGPRAPVLLSCNETRRSFALSQTLQRALRFSAALLHLPQRQLDNQEFRVMLALHRGQLFLMPDHRASNIDMDSLQDSVWVCSCRKVNRPGKVRWAFAIGRSLFESDGGLPILPTR